MFSAVARFIEKFPLLHGVLLRVWRLFPPRLAGFLKGILARNWVVGAVAVMVDTGTSPPEILLVEHSYRRRGRWGLPGGSLESVPGSPTVPRGDASPDNVIEDALRREVSEELGIMIEDIRLLRVDAVPYVAEEPGPYRLDFYYLCRPSQGFAALRSGIESGSVHPVSPEITAIKLVPLAKLSDYDLFSSDARFLECDLGRLGGSY